MYTCTYIFLVVQLCEYTVYCLIYIDLYYSYFNECYVYVTFCALINSHEYGKLAADMNGLRNKKGPIELIPSMKSDFENMKLAFAKGPTRAYPDFSPNANPFILVTDFHPSVAQLFCLNYKIGKSELLLALLARIMLLKQVTRRIKGSCLRSL